MYKRLFWLFVWIGKPFGGIKPRRITHWLAKKAFGSSPPRSADFKWYRDRYGSEMLLHPHYYIDYSIIAFGAYETQLDQFIELNIKPGMVCLDVGANIGAVSLHLARKCAPTGVVHCFEPVPAIFRRLQDHAQRNRLEGVMRLHQVALSESSEGATMYTAIDSHSNQGMGSIVTRDPSLLPKQIQVRTTTLDEFAASEKLTRLDFVKLDIQGAEPLFLMGGLKTLQRFKPALCLEISPEDLANSGRTSLDLLRQLDELGYGVFELTFSGRIGARLNWSTMASDYSSSVVYCRLQEA